MLKLAKPTTFTRELVQTSARKIVDRCEAGLQRRVVLMVPAGALSLYAAVDVVLATPQLVGGSLIEQKVPGHALNPDRFCFETPQLPTNREVVFDLQAHQTVHAAVLTGTLVIGVLTQYYEVS